MDSDRYTETDNNEPTVDIERTAEIADILRNARRIQVILELDVAGEDGLAVGELADRIAEREHGPHFSPEARKAVYVALYQSHVPTLEVWDGDGVIDCERDVVTRGRRFEEVRSALSRL